MNYKDIRTYPAMNAQIVELLVMSDRKVDLYAAKRIEELEKDIAKSKQDICQLIEKWEANMKEKFDWIEKAKTETDRLIHISSRQAISDILDDLNLIK